MESLAYVHQAIAYTDPNPAPPIVVGENFNWRKPPSSAWLKFLGISVLIAAGITLADSAQASTVSISTNSGNGVYVRSLPSTGANPIGGLGEGEAVNVEASTTPGWFVISSGSYKNAYIDSQWTVPANSGSYVPANSGNYGNGLGKFQVKTNQGLGVNVRALPTTNSDIMGGLQEKAVITIADSGTPGWGKITSGDFAGSFVTTDWLASLGTGDGTGASTGSDVQEKTYTVTTNNGFGVKVRTAGSTGSSVIGGVTEGGTIRAKASGTPGWLVISAGDLAGGYISEAWVVTTS